LLQYCSTLALVIALALIFVARPLAVITFSQNPLLSLSLAKKISAFISWVGFEVQSPLICYLFQLIGGVENWGGGGGVSFFFFFNFIFFKTVPGFLGFLGGIAFIVIQGQHIVVDGHVDAR